jgi:hypothetical protein
MVKLDAKTNNSTQTYSIHRTLLEQKTQLLNPDDKYTGWHRGSFDPFHLWIELDAISTPIITLSEAWENCGSLTPATVAIFVTWLYRDKFEPTDITLEELVKCWVFGRLLRSPQFQNCVMRELLSCVKSGARFGYGALHYLYFFTSDVRSGVRKLAVDAILNMHARDEMNCLDPLTLEFLGMDIELSRDDYVMEEDLEYMV